MSNNTDGPSFFENGTAEQFEYCYQIYPQVLRLKAEEQRGEKRQQELIKLDNWYQNELPRLISARGKDKHMSYDELVSTMRWKQMRGKFYPQLSYLIKVNTPRAVVQETKKAFRKLPNLEQALTALSNLKGVGITMASALLAAAAPESAPFMADECLLAIPDIEGIDYTAREYLNFATHIQETVARLNTETAKNNSSNSGIGAAAGNVGVISAGADAADAAVTAICDKKTETEMGISGDASTVTATTAPRWSPHRLELALWAYYVANEFQPQLLDDMPGRQKDNGGIVAASVNGNAGAAADDEDNTDLDDESLSALEPTSSAANSNVLTKSATAVVGNTLLQQDGDSNFASNDSNSQDPTIDENTTQTIASASSSSLSRGDLDGNDDATIATPLASDSESNLDVAVRYSQPNSNNSNACDVPASNAVITSNGNGIASVDSNSNNAISYADELREICQPVDSSTQVENCKNNSNNCDDSVKVCSDSIIPAENNTIIGDESPTAATTAINCRKRSLDTDESHNEDVVAANDATGNCDASITAMGTKRLRTE